MPRVRRSSEPRASSRFLLRGGIRLAPGRRFERGLEPASQMGRRLAREGDGREVLGTGLSGRQKREHPVDQHRRLAGTRTGLHEQRHIQRGSDLVAGGLVGETARRLASEGHQTPLRSIARIGSSRGSPGSDSLFRSARATLSATSPQIDRKGQNRQSDSSAVWGKDPEATRLNRSSSVSSTRALRRIEGEPLHLPLARRKDVARGHVLDANAGAREKRGGGSPVEGVLEQPSAIQRTLGTVLFLEGVVSAGLVVPHREPAGLRLVDPVDLALEEEGPPGSPDLDRIGGSEQLVPARAFHPEWNLEPARRRAGILGFGAKEDVTGREEVVLLRPKGGEVGRGNELFPARDPFSRDGLEARDVARGIEPQALGAEVRHEGVENLVQQASELARVQPLALGALFVGRREVEHVLVEVHPRAFRELFEAGGRERLLRPAGIEVGRGRGNAPVPGRESLALALPLRARAVREPRVRALDLDREPGAPVAARIFASHHSVSSSGAPSGTKVAGGPKRLRERIVSGVRRAFAFPVELEEDRRGEALGVLEDVAIREGENDAPAYAREERAEGTASLVRGAQAREAET